MDPLPAIKLVDQKRRDLAKAQIDAAPEGWLATVREEKRRDRQNRPFWEIMGDLAKAEPEGRRWTKETWRDALMHATGHAIQFEMGIEGSGAFPIGFRSSQLTVPLMSQVIEAAFAYGSRHGVVFTIDKRRAAEMFGSAR